MPKLFRQEVFSYSDAVYTHIMIFYFALTMEMRQLWETLDIDEGKLRGIAWFWAKNLIKTGFR
jgi:hypothetical protein